MKNFKIILLIIIATLVYSCDIDEDPIFLDPTATYSDISIASGALWNLSRIDNLQLNGATYFRN